MEIKQQLRLSQQLVMTPQLQQAIKLLQMSRMELVDMVREELLENPVLEDHGESAPADLVAKEEAAAEAKAKEENNDIDWERYLENQATQGSLPGSGVRAASSDDLPGVEATLTRADNLAEHLIGQLRLVDLLDEERIFSALVIGNLDDNGYLRVEGISAEDIVPRLSLEAGIEAEDAEEVLKIIQHLDPVGIASRSLRECLLIQATQQGHDQLVLRVIDEHLPDLERRAYAAVAKSLQVPVEDVYDIAQCIMDLDPRPGRNHTPSEPQYITPDVYVHRVGDEYFVVANDDGMPRLKISGFYRSAMSNDSETKEYIQNKLRSAQWLIRSIDQRRKTIVRVTECIVHRQKDFMEQGIEHLKPMILRDVADEVGMHESTISRVTSNKYVHTPRGIFELKYFFNSAIRRDNRDDIASESVKQAIKKLVDAEDPKKPLSDQKLVDLLASEGVVIARRTIAKYREMLGILSSSKRKRYF